MKIDDMDAKLAQAYQVIGSLCDNTEESEYIRALDYFLSDEYDENFLPWPREG